MEIDKNLIPILKDTLVGYTNIQVINEDVLKTDLNRIIAESGCKRTVIIGNLPYYITTPIIMGLLEKGIGADSIIVMMQKEVADRDKVRAWFKDVRGDFCGSSVLLHRGAGRICAEGSFVPAPKVDSAVLKLNVRRTSRSGLMMKRCSSAASRRVSDRGGKLWPILCRESAAWTRKRSQSVFTL